MNKNQLVTRLELIDAIAVLHVIDDSPESSLSARESSFSSILNKPQRSKRKRQGKSGRSAYAVKLEGYFRRLDEITFSSNTEGDV